MKRNLVPNIKQSTVWTSHTIGHTSHIQHPLHITHHPSCITQEGRRFCRTHPNWDMKQKWKHLHSTLPRQRLPAWVWEEAVVWGTWVLALSSWPFLCMSICRCSAGLADVQQQSCFPIAPLFPGLCGPEWWWWSSCSINITRTFSGTQERRLFLPWWNQTMRFTAWITWIKLGLNLD